MALADYRSPIKCVYPKGETRHGEMVVICDRTETHQPITDLQTFHEDVELYRRARYRDLVAIERRTCGTVIERWEMKG